VYRLLKLGQVVFGDGESQREEALSGSPSIVRLASLEWFCRDWLRLESFGTLRSSPSCLITSLCSWQAPDTTRSIKRQKKNLISLLARAVVYKTYCIFLSKQIMVKGSPSSSAHLVEFSLKQFDRSLR